MKILGILNLTPDSFSDGNSYDTIVNAYRTSQQMLSKGATAIDVGAESTRPGAEVISLEEEWKRLEPFLQISIDIPLSIDTRNFETAEKALYFNQVKYLNDVSGFRDERMIKLAAERSVKIIAMHSLTVPADRNVVLTTPPIKTLCSWMAERFVTFQSAGIKPENIIFDPGIGFGKTPEQSIEIIENAEILADQAHALGTEILYGHSRKSFLSKFTSNAACNRDTETAEITNYLHSRKVDYIRVHNVAANKAAVKNNGGRY